VSGEQVSEGNYHGRLAVRGGVIGGSKIRGTSVPPGIQVQKTGEKEKGEKEKRMGGKDGELRYGGVFIIRPRA